jgi:hypothetical protein
MIELSLIFRRKFSYLSCFKIFSPMKGLFGAVGLFTALIEEKSC